MELLKQLYSIHSMSGQEGAMRKFIKNYVRENIPEAEVVQDHKNLYIVKGESDTYPCVVAHLDQVQTKHSPDFRVLEFDGRLFGFSAMNARQEGLGADDKNGIWVALKCLETFDAIKVALFREEEVGCCGSSDADMSFFTDCRFAIQADRRNGGDLITDIGGRICSDEFLDDIADICDARGYKETSGLMTDVETLCDNGIGVSCINFSCGYYNPHTDQEFTVVSELVNCLGFAVEVIRRCTKVYTHKRVAAPRGYWGYGGSYGWSSDKDDWKYGYYHNSKADDKEEANGGYSGYGYDEEVVLVDFKDYESLEDAIYDFIYENAENNIPLDELWYYISADCETYGISYEDFCAIADMVYEDYFYPEEEEERDEEHPWDCSKHF